MDETSYKLLMKSLSILREAITTKDHIGCDLRAEVLAMHDVVAGLTQIVYDVTKQK